MSLSIAKGVIMSDIGCHSLTSLGLCIALLASGCGSSNSPTHGNGATGVGGAPAAGPPGSCSSPNVQITEIDVGAAVSQNEDEAARKPLPLAAIASGGSRGAWMAGA